MTAAEQRPNSIVTVGSTTNFLAESLRTYLCALRSPRDVRVT